MLPDQETIQLPMVDSYNMDLERQRLPNRQKPELDLWLVELKFMLRINRMS